MKDHTKRLLFPGLATLLMQSMAIVSLAAAHPPENTNWNNLSQLAPGSEIKIVLGNKKSYQGKFQSLSDEAIVVRLGHGVRIFDRQNVLRVLTKGKSRRLRNTLIGAAVGAGAGLAFGGAADAEDFFHFSTTGQNYKIFIPSFAVVGAIVGAALPARRWHKVYQRGRRPTGPPPRRACSRPATIMSRFRTRFRPSSVRRVVDMEQQIVSKMVVFAPGFSVRDSLNLTGNLQHFNVRASEFGKT
jgi:hypothetical protein